MSITPPRDSVALAALPRLRVSTSLPVLAKDKLEHASTFEKIHNSEFGIQNYEWATHHLSPFFEAIRLDHGETHREHQRAQEDARDLARLGYAQELLRGFGEIGRASCRERV